jgi:hypothetical protein
MNLTDRLWHGPGESRGFLPHHLALARAAPEPPAGYACVRDIERIILSSITAYFQTLLDWKKLPAYRMEPRVDSIVGFALPQILNQARNLEVATVIPELPLRIGSVQPDHEGKEYSNKSYKVDFFVVTKCGKSFLIEFKTDSGSRRDKQDRYLESAQAQGLGAVISGILRLYAATTYKKKYRHLLAKLEDAGLIENSETGYEVSVVNDELKILYVQPHAKEGDEERDVLDFEAVAQAIEEHFEGEEFMLTAAQAFRSWAED